jgi:adenosylcobyric acid synthase
MLCRHIDDPVESGAGVVAGLGVLDADIAFAPDKTLRHWDTPLHGYEIHHGRLTRCGDDDWLGVGIRRGAVYGTHWHGLLDNDAVRRQWLTEAAVAAGRPGFVVADDVDVAARRDAQLDLMADLLTAHLDVDAVMGLLEHGAPKRPIVATALRR